MNIRHTFEERLLCAQRYLDGEAACQIGKDYGIDHHDVIAYGLRYESYGESGLHKQPYVIASYAQKLHILQEIKAEYLSLTEASVKYRFSRTTLKKWLCITREEGYQALANNKPRGRPPKDMSKQSNPKEPLSELEKLQAEVRYLRAENDLLKKVKALVEQREAQNRKIGRKPSKN